MSEQQRITELLRDLHGYIGASIPQTISEHYRGCDLLDRIDAVLAGKLPDHIADVSNMVAPEGWQLVPVTVTPEMFNASMKWDFWPIRPSNFQGLYDAMLAAAPKPECCRPVAMTDMRFVVCPDCGNKRCPRANDHRNACTGSNELGQEGSAYPAAPKQQGGEPCASEPPSSSPD
ncbi:hypothetical protein [Aeromonas caviae]|uniref:hypothetical protein n=1 Tax=Aeromonas caviae TaxID=648 RepID=UPI00227E8D1C|nr:hypothetical protein [Aeromonas caviae]MCY9814429.1 hypothetical protein [Aeromonas caviae]